MALTSARLTRTYSGRRSARGTSGLVLWFRSASARPLNGSGFFRGNAQPVGHSHQIDQGFRAHLSHDLAAMDLHRHLAQLELIGDLLAGPAADHQGDDLPLACRQRIEALPQFGNKAGLLAPGPVTFD